VSWDRGYYYRSKKVRGRHRRVYVGKGKAAELAAGLDALQRSERQARIAAWQAERADIEALDRPLCELIELADELAEAALLAAGYRQHHRSEWRKRRDDPDEPGRATETPG
jgi:hypothetical protein